MKAILVTGTPATGKTLLAKALAARLGCRHIKVKDIIKEHDLEESYDRTRHCSIVDEEDLRGVLEKIIEDSSECLVIDSHMSHFVGKDKASICIVTKCDLKELKRRMEARGYPEDKIKDNLECEIMQVCESEAFDQGHNIVIVNTTFGFSADDVKRRIENIRLDGKQD